MQYINNNNDLNSGCSRLKFYRIFEPVKNSPQPGAAHAGRMRQNDHFASHQEREA